MCKGILVELEMEVNVNKFKGVVLYYDVEVVEFGVDCEFVVVYLCVVMELFDDLDNCVVGLFVLCMVVEVYGGFGVVVVEVGISCELLYCMLFLNGNLMLKILFVVFKIVGLCLFVVFV